MNKDLEQFGDQELQNIIDFSDSDTMTRLARIALSVKQAKPIGIYNQQLFNLQGSAVVLNIDQSVEAGFVSDDGELSSTRGYLYTTPQPAHTEQAKSAANEFLPQNLDRALTIMGVALPESKEEFNFQAQRWTQRLIDRVIRYENEFQVQESHVEKHSCKWKPDEDSVYSTSCGNEWQFTEGGLEDNKIKFCPYCSGKIAAPKPESE